MLANEPCTAWRLVIATSPGAQTSGTASGRRSEPAAATIALMSTLPNRVRAGHHPQPVGRRAAVQLAHEVEAVGDRVEVGAVPVGPAVLVPGDRPAEAGLLDPHRLVERHEVVAVDRGGDRPAAAGGRTRAGRRGRLHEPRTICRTSSGAPSGAAGSIIFAGWRPLTAVVPPTGSDNGFTHPRLRSRPSAPSAGRPWRSSAAPLVTGAWSSISITSRSMSSSSSATARPRRRRTRCARTPRGWLGRPGRRRRSGPVHGCRGPGPGRSPSRRYSIIAYSASP